MNATQTYLKIASAVVIIFGELVILAAFPATDFIIRFLIDLIYWPLNNAETFTAKEFRLLFAITGAITIAWGVLFWMISSQLYPKDPKLARTMILTSISTWFIIDCALSIAVGTPINVILNVPFLLAFLIPLWKTPGLQEAPGHT